MALAHHQRRYRQRRYRQRRRLAAQPLGLATVAVAVAMLAAGCTTSPTGPPAAAGPSTGPTAGTGDGTVCPASGVLISANEPDAAMGLRAMSIVLVNCGSQPYRLNGYPAVRVLDADRQPLQVTIHQGASVTASINDPGPNPLTLNPGESALTSLWWRNTVASTENLPMDGAYLEIVPVAGEPPQTVAELVDLGTTGKLDVSAWRRTPDAPTESPEPTPQPGSTGTSPQPIDPRL